MVKTGGRITRERTGMVVDSYTRHDGTAKEIAARVRASKKFFAWLTRGLPPSRPPLMGKTLRRFHELCWKADLTQEELYVHAQRIRHGSSPEEIARRWGRTPGTVNGLLEDGAEKLDGVRDQLTDLFIVVAGDLVSCCARARRNPYPKDNGDADERFLRPRGEVAEEAESWVKWTLGEIGEEWEEE